jgi:hypothetical protein
MHLRPLVIAAAAALAGAALAACGAAAPQHHSAAARPSSSPAAPAASSKMGGAVEDYFFPGDGAQYTAGGAFSSIMAVYQSQLAARCMDRYGFAVPAVTLAQARAQEFDNTQFPDLSRIARTHELNPSLTEPLPAASPIPASQQAAFRTDGTRCSARASPFTELTEAAVSLVGEWQTDVGRIQSSPQVQSRMPGFTACVEKAGTPASQARSFGGYLAWVTGQESRQRAPSAVESEDARFAAVFVRCAGPVVSAETVLQLASRSDFLHRHRRAVRALIALGVVAVSAAARLLKASG